MHFPCLFPADGVSFPQPDKKTPGKEESIMASWPILDRHPLGETIRRTVERYVGKAQSLFGRIFSTKTEPPVAKFVHTGGGLMDAGGVTCDTAAFAVRKMPPYDGLPHRTAHLCGILYFRAAAGLMAYFRKERGLPPVPASWEDVPENIDTGRYFGDSMRELSEMERSGKGRPASEFRDFAARMFSEVPAAILRGHAVITNSGKKEFFGAGAWMTVASSFFNAREARAFEEGQNVLDLFDGSVNDYALPREMVLNDPLRAFAEAGAPPERTVEVQATAGAFPESEKEVISHMEAVVSGLWNENAVRSTDDTAYAEKASGHPVLNEDVPRIDKLPWYDEAVDYMEKMDRALADVLDDYVTVGVSRDDYSGYHVHRRFTVHEADGTRCGVERNWTRTPLRLDPGTDILADPVADALYEANHRRLSANIGKTLGIPLDDRGCLDVPKLEKELAGLPRDSEMRENIQGKIDKAREWLLSDLVDVAPTLTMRTGFSYDNDARNGNPFSFYTERTYSVPSVLFPGDDKSLEVRDAEGNVSHVDFSGKGPKVMKDVESGPVPRDFDEFRDAYETHLRRQYPAQLVNEMIRAVESAGESASVSMSPAA